MPDQIQEFVGQYDVTYPVGAEPENGISYKYGVYGIPTSFLFGPDGRLYHRFDGFTTEAPLERRSKNFLIESIEALSEEFTMDEVLADQNFPEVEKDFIRRRAHPKFDRVRFDKPSGINALTKPLGEARVALVSTAGAHCRSDPPFNLKSPIGDPTYREIPKNADLRDILLSHIGYDVREVSADKNSVFPLDRLRELEADGVIGSLGPRLFSFMGYVAETDPLVGETAPEVVAKVKGDRVDLVILSPA